MIQEKELNCFKVHLEKNTTLGKRVISNTLSRIRRANSILEMDGNDFYIERLSRMEEFQVLSYTVKSQIKSAVRKYLEYKKNKI